MDQAAITLRGYDLPRRRPVRWRTRSRLAGGLLPGMGEWMVIGPFFIVDGYDVTWYDDISSVGWDIEARDLGSCTLFSADGDVLRLETDGMRVRATTDIVRRDAEALTKSLRGNLLSPPRRNMFGRQKKRDVPFEKVRSAVLPELIAEFIRGPEVWTAVSAG
jgi:hypothetical protein